MAIISFAKKNGKSSLTAALLLLHLCGPEAKQNTQLVSTAQSRDQAALVFDLAAKMVRLDPTLSAVVAISDAAKKLRCGELGTLYKALSADAATAHGNSPVFALHDELGQVRGPRSELFNAVENAMGAHDSPLSVVLSTQAPTDNDLLSILIDDGISGKDPRVIVSLYAADENEDPFSERALKQANPAAGDFLSLKELKDQAARARRMPSQEALYRNYTLNQRVEASSPFVTKAVWQENGGPPDSTGPVYGGLDLSETSDLTALVLVSPLGGFYHVVPTFWLPQEGLEDRARKDRVPYDLWASQGLLQTTPGRSVGYEYVAEQIAKLFRERDVRLIAFDRFNMRHLRPWLLKAGLSEDLIDERFRDFGQGFVSMSPALRSLESALLDKKIRHGNHALLTMCAANAITRMDEAGNRKLDKKRSRGRIDGMVALAMGMAVATEDAHRSSVFAGVDLEKILEDA